MNIIRTIAVLVFGGIALLGSPNQSHAAVLDTEDTITVPKGDMLSANDMNSDRGGTDVQNNILSAQSLQSSSTGNTLDVGGNLATGMVTVNGISGGLGSYVFNTGNNTSINSAVSVNVQLVSGH